MARSVLGSCGVVWEVSIKAVTPLFALLVTLICESLVILAFARWWNRPIRSLLLSGVLVNAMTQPFLWLWLAIFYRRYVIALLFAETFIVLSEAIFLKLISTRGLSWRESFLLSGAMNSLSFGVGLFLPL